MTSELNAHRTWCALANKRLESIYNQLCEFENIICEEQDDGPKLLELLETISEIQEHHHSVVQTIISHKENIGEKCNGLETQMELLQKSMDLLKLETNWSPRDG